MTSVTNMLVDLLSSRLESASHVRFKMAVWDGRAYRWKSEAFNKHQLLFCVLLYTFAEIVLYARIYINKTRWKI